MVSSDASHSQGGDLGDEQEWPPGFRFHPTDEELVLYYLKRKICRKKLKLNIIAETDVYKWDPEELPGLSILQTGDRQWFFFNPRDRKYPNGARSNRATRHGYWKATGKDRTVTCNSRSVGLKKTLVFYRGRAPNGERTDWVMHEYTLDEEELKRCQNVQEYYALYKVYKKSGPGPKNGEQYGAPFREEDWNHDCPDFDNSANLDILAEKVKEVLPNDNVKFDSQVPSFTIEELMKDLTEHAPFDLLELNDYAHNPSQVSKEDMKSTLVNPPSKEIIAQEPADLFYITGVQHNLQTSFDLSPTDVTQLQLHEAPLVASDAIVHEQEIYILPEADFLEIDDLLVPEPSQRNVAEPLNNLQVEETDGLSELDLYHDAAMFLNDLGPGPDQVIIDQYDYYLDYSPLGPGEVFDHPYVEDGGLIDNQLFPNDANQSNHQFHPDGAPEAHEQEGSVLTSAEFYPGSNCDQTSGIVYGSSNFSLQANQNQSGIDDDGTSSWFSSAIWSFVESIPTTPASAAENGLVNRAFGRMSSFSRIRVNVMNTNISAGSDSETTKSSCRKRGFIFFPVLVAAIAILWVVLGTVRIWATGITA